METDWSLIDFSQVEVISYDLGYTILGVNAQIITKLLNASFETNYSVADVMIADYRMRTDYLRDPVTSHSAQTTHYSDVLCRSLSFIDQRFTEKQNATKLEIFREACRYYHDEHNFFNLIYEDALTALRILRGAKVRMIVISNAHGTLERDLQRFGLSQYFEFILDSTVEGVAKPDPEIFVRATDRCGVKAENILHIGDNIFADCRGASSIGAQTALYDPVGIYSSAVDMFTVFRNHVDLAEEFLSENNIY
jgi:HAD superfamily hydrolase (TIGR01509 family)